MDFLPTWGEYINTSILETKMIFITNFLLKSENFDNDLF
jgi:hypothetical protein